MAENRTTLHSIQATRAVAALLVVLHHLSLRFEQRVSNTNFLSVFNEIGFAGVDLFFVISGLIMVVTCQRHFGHASALFPFLWRRATRILPIYWIFTIVQLAAILLLASETDRKITTENIIASFLVLPQSVYPILAPGWTLTYEMFFYLVFSFLFLIPPRFMFPLLSFWGLATIGIYSTQTTDGMHSTTDLLRLPIYGSPMTLEFIAGCLIGMLISCGVTRFAKTSLVAGNVWFVFGWQMVETLTTTSAEFGMTRIITFGVASTLILYGLVAIETKNDRRSDVLGVANRWMTTIGDASYSLYLSHLLVIGFFALAWKWLGITGAVYQALFELLILATCIGFAVAAYQWIERPMLQRIRRPNGPQS